jgi:hypothetical protein
MSIAFESEEVQSQKLRERLRLMSDEELVKFGKMVRGLSEPRVGVNPAPWQEQLQEGRAEWRRRYPRFSFSKVQPDADHVPSSQSE